MYKFACHNCRYDPSGDVVSVSTSRDAPASCLSLVLTKNYNVPILGGWRLGLGDLCLVPKTLFCTDFLSLSEQGVYA